MKCIHKASCAWSVVTKPTVRRKTPRCGFMRKKISRLLLVSRQVDPLAGEFRRAIDESADAAFALVRR